MTNILSRLQAWYMGECNGDWEHTYGISISTADNPGWIIDIDLEDTTLQSVNFDRVNIQSHDDNDWIICFVENSKFHGRGGVQNLSQIIEIFLNWAEITRNP